MADESQVQLIQKMELVRRAWQLYEDAELLGMANAEDVKSSFAALLYGVIVQHRQHLTVRLSPDPAKHGMYRVEGVDPEFLFSLGGQHEVACSEKLLGDWGVLIDVRMRLWKQYEASAVEYLKGVANSRTRWSAVVKKSAKDALTLIEWQRAEVVPVIYTVGDGTGSSEQLHTDPSMVPKNHWSLNTVGIKPVFCGFAPDGTPIEGPGEHKGWVVAFAEGT